MYIHSVRKGDNTALKKCESEGGFERAIHDCSFIRIERSLMLLVIIFKKKCVPELIDLLFSKQSCSRSSMALEILRYSVLRFSKV